MNLLSAWLGPALALAGAAAGGSEYSFINVADSSGELDQFFVGPLFPGPELNDAGEVAFLATLDAGGRGIFRGDGGELTTIALTGGSFLNFTWQPVINNDGSVAFEAEFTDPGRDSVWISDGVTTNPVIISSIPFFFGYTIGGVNSAGLVGFHTLDATGNHFLMTGVGGGTAGVVFGAGTGFVGGFLGQPDLNDRTELAFTGAAPGGGFGVFRGLSAPPTTIALSSDEFSLFHATDLNNAGDVAIWAELDVGGQGVFVGDGAEVATIALTGDEFANFGPVGINDGGEVAFSGFTMAGVVGIFTGPDPESDRVIGTGDALFGSTVTNVIFFRGLNADGQIAFFYSLANFVHGVAIATPSDEPPPCPGDLDDDDFINGSDLGLLLLAWGPCPGKGACPADLSGDGMIDGADLGMLLLCWTG